MKTIKIADITDKDILDSILEMYREYCNMLCEKEGLSKTSYPDFETGLKYLEERLKMATKFREVVDETDRVKSAIAATLGGTDDQGFPTGKFNYLQRARALVKSESQLTTLQLRVEVMERALKTNHKWHQDYDEHGGYDESDLCEENVKALSPATSTNLLAELEDYRKKYGKLPLTE